MPYSAAESQVVCHTLTDQLHFACGRSGVECGMVEATKTSTLYGHNTADALDEAPQAAEKAAITAQPAEAVAAVAEPAAERVLYGSREAVRCIWAAKRCERERTWEDLPDSDDPDAEHVIARRDRAEQNLYTCMHALKCAFFPREEDECCVYFEIAGCTHGRPCACGRYNPSLRLTASTRHSATNPPTYRLPTAPQVRLPTRTLHGRLGGRQRAPLAHLQRHPFAWPQWPSSGADISSPSPALTCQPSRRRLHPLVLHEAPSQRSAPCVPVCGHGLQLIPTHPSPSAPPSPPRALLRRRLRLLRQNLQHSPPAGSPVASRAPGPARRPAALLHLPCGGTPGAPPH